MPFDLHSIPGKRFHTKLEDKESLVQLVREQYPEALCEGGVGTYSFFIKDELGQTVYVAEAWIHPTRRGWWIRIRPK